MSSKKKVDLVAYFLSNSPASQYRAFTKIVPVDDYSKYPPPTIKSDEEYLCNFFDRLQVFGASSANFSTYKGRKTWVSPEFRRIFPTMLVMKKPTPGSWQQPEQLIESIRLVSMHAGDGTIPYQELEQRLQIASSHAVGEAMSKLVYLFKMLLNKRDKISPGSLELDANLQLSRAIIDALSRTQKAEDQNNWRQLQVMEKLLRAREYQKKGFRDIALNNFEEIFRDDAASTKTRMEALKVLCTYGEQLGDPSTLEKLMNEIKARGQQQYEEIILTSIKRIKGVKE